MSNNNKCEYPVVPKDFVTAPIFASKPQQGPRVVTVKDRIYTIGGFKPISEDRPACPALDIRHGRALFTILSFVDPNGEDAVVRFSINEFCKRFASANGGRYSRDVRGILSDLERCWFKITHKDGNGDSESYRILKNVSVHFKAPRRQPKYRDFPQDEIWFDEVELHPKFFSMLREYLSIAQIHLKTLTAIRSPLAQAIYAYIPSRAVHNTKAKTFEITLRNLLTQVGHTVPHAKSLRKKIFTQNNNPIISQLDGVSIVSGVLKVNLCETADKEDYKLQFWVEDKLQTEAERVDVKQKNGVLLDIWLKSGQSIEEFNRRIKYPLPVIDDYQVGLCRKGNIELKSNEVFFRQAYALLGEGVFNELLAEAKAAVLEGRNARKSETQRLIYYIKEALGRA